MLHRIFGVCGSGKRKLIQEKIKTCLEEGKQVFVLVPEQAAASYEYQLLLSCGNLSQNAEVTNFSRLANIVFRTVGFPKGRIPTAAEKKILLSQCVFKLKDSFSYLNLKEDPDSISSLMEELEVLKRSGLTPDVLSSLSEEDFSSPELRDVLKETAVLLGSFALAQKDLFRDPSDEGEHLVKALSENDFFKDTCVFIDGFWDFTYIQEKIIEQIFSQAKEVTISFAADKKRKDLFEKPLRSAERILSLARKKNIEVRDQTLSREEDDSALGFVREHFMRGGEPYEEIPQNISFYACKSPSEEAKLAAREIIRLVKGGARWNEIAVLSRNGASEILSLILEEKGIPHFSEETKPLSSTPLAQTVLLACRLALGLCEEDGVRTYIKNGVFRAGEEGRFALETYVSVWGLERRSILSPAPFVRHPDGYLTHKKQSLAELERINFAKEEIFSPLRDLSFGLAGETVTEKISAVIGHLSRIGTEEVMLREAAEAKERQNFDRAGEILRTWNSLLSALSALSAVLGEEKVSPERFLDLLTLAFSDTLPGKLPPGQDRVEIGRVDFARPEEAKYIILTGLNTGVFPAPESKGGLLKKGQKEELKKRGFSLPGSEEDLADEYFYFHLAVSFAKKELILTYSAKEEKLGGGDLSVIGKHLLSLLPKLTLCPFDSKEELPQTKEEAFSRYLSVLGTDSPEEEALAKYFIALPEYTERILSATKGLAFKENRDLLKEELPYKDCDINMVYSRIDSYTKCPFSFFARYLLEAKSVEKAEVYPSTAGNFVHKILELVCLSLSEKGQDIALLSKDEIEKEVKLAVSNHLKALEITEVTGSLTYLVDKLEESSLLILLNLKEEFSQSSFRPIFFEKNLKELSGTYQIPLKDGTCLCLYGDIDRVDQYKGKDGKTYVRVVDYKTGGKKFSLVDVANGLSIQMLLYLFALWNQGYHYGGEDVKPLPAGVVYLNGLATPRVCKTDKELETLKNDPFSSLSREGLLVDEEELLVAQEREGQGLYIPVAFGKSKASGVANLVSLEKLGKLKSKVEKDFKILAENLKSGRIEASPLTKKDSDPCTYCPYLSICRRKEEDRRAYRYDVSTEKELFGEEERA